MSEVTVHWWVCDICHARSRSRRGWASVPWGYGNYDDLCPDCAAEGVIPDNGLIPEPCPSCERTVCFCGSSQR